MHLVWRSRSRYGECGRRFWWFLNADVAALSFVWGKRKGRKQLELLRSTRIRVLIAEARK